MGDGPVVVVDDRRCTERAVAVDAPRWAALARQALEAEQVTAGELGLLFVDRDEMARLNAQHLGELRPTDVLAFPIDGAAHPHRATHGAGTLIGDVVVCPSYAAASCRTAARGPGDDSRDVSVAGAAGPGATTAKSGCDPAKSKGKVDLESLAGGVFSRASLEPDGNPEALLEAELALLVIHGVLHVLGYDHARRDDAAIMRSRERQLLAAYTSAR